MGKLKTVDVDLVDEVNGRQVFYVYIDYKLDDGKPFYVGKGVRQRVGIAERNIYWQAIAKKHGWRREVFASSYDEEFAFELEILTIERLKTFRDAWPPGVGYGANLSKGGEGPLGAIVSEETRLKIAQGNMGKKMSEEAKKKISEAHKGKTLTEEHKEKLSKAHAGITLNLSEEERQRRREYFKQNNPNAGGKMLTEELKQRLSEMNSGENSPWFNFPVDEDGYKMTKEQRQKISEARMGKPGHPVTEENKLKTSLRFRGINSPCAILSEEQVYEIRRLADGGMKHKDIAQKLDIKKCNVSAIASRRNWKHLPEKE